MASTKALACFFLVAAVLLISDCVSAAEEELGSKYEPDQLGGGAFCAQLRGCIARWGCVECCIRNPERERCNRCCRPRSDYQNGNTGTHTEIQTNN